MNPTPSREMVASHEPAEIAKGYLRLGLLIMAHVATMVATTWLARDDEWPGSLNALKTAVHFAQASMVGLWVGFSRIHLFFRVGVLAVYTAGMAFLTQAMTNLRSFGQALDLMGHFWLLFVIPASLLAAICLVIRRRRADVIPQVTQSGEPPPPFVGFRFGLWQLVVWTAAAAVVFALARIARRGDFESPQWLSMVLAQCPLMLVVSLGSLWATLSPGSVGLRFILLLLLALLIGILPAFYSPSQLSGAKLYVFWSLVTFLQTLLVMLSLLVVRINGFRLAAADSADRRTAESDA